MKYFAIGDEDTVLGFGMAGVRGRAVRDSQEAERVFGAALEDEEIGIIIITERIADMIRPVIERFVFTENFPLIVEVPDWRGPVEGRPGIRELVNSAIGISL
ncbi:MAG: V-type ATP synthase subunit F [Spirochaetes bacterium]|nr:V-type ATP synthase subunit F [Spirochaetota bacterium]